MYSENVDKLKKENAVISEITWAGPYSKIGWYKWSGNFQESHIHSHTQSTLTLAHKTYTKINSNVTCTKSTGTKTKVSSRNL